MSLLYSCEELKSDLRTLNRHSREQRDHYSLDLAHYLSGFPSTAAALEQKAPQEGSTR